MIKQFQGYGTLLKMKKNYYPNEAFFSPSNIGT